MPREAVPITEISASNLSVNYGETKALDISQLKARGRVIAVIGHNGSGKSTLIKTLLELLPCKTGSLKATIQIGEEKRELVPELDMAFSPETGAVFSDVTVESYIKLWCRIKHGTSDYYKRAGATYIERMEIVPLLPKLGRELSKGQRRRVQACVGFLTKPNFFLFDEPFDGLDISQSNQLSDLMVEASRNMSLLVSSHRMEVVERIADTVIVLKAGRVAACGTVEDVCAQLCQRSIAISSFGEAGVRLFENLKARYPELVVSLIGSQLFITGYSIDLARLTEFIAHEHQLAGVALKEVKPSLVDAMHYHLSRVSSSH